MRAEIPKTALVTGAAKRIGRAIALDLAERGFAVGIHCHTAVDAANAVRAEIEAAGGRAAVLSCDLRDPAAMRRLIPECAEALGPVGVLVNNASVFEPDGPGDFDDTVWDAHMALHVKAPVYLASALAAGLPDGADGVVVNMIDQRVLALRPTFISYTLSKSALWTATQTLAQALAPRVRVCGIAPGPALMNTRQSPDQFAAQQDSVLLKRGPELAEICNTVRFILDTPSMTGTLTPLDGGQHLAWETPDVMSAGD